MKSSPVPIFDAMPFDEKEYQKEYQKKYRAKHRERINAAQKVRYCKNQEKRQKQWRDFYHSMTPERKEIYLEGHRIRDRKRYKLNKFKRLIAERRAIINGH